ncbi:MAG: hypothetical protein ACJ8F1_21865 [Polyangia bacterium]
MKKLAHTFFLLTGVLALGAGACSSSSTGSTTGTGGSGGGSGNNLFPGGKPLVPTSTGYVDDTANTGVIGPWYTYSDAAGPAAGPNDPDFAGSSCNKGSFPMTACSTVTPGPGKPVPPDPTTGALCANGTGAVVLPGASGTSDYADLWGAGLALDFNNKGGDAGPKGTFDLSKYTGIGFTFTGTNIPVNHMRVNFPFTGEHNGSDSPYWQGDTQDYSSLANNKTITIKWADVGGPKYLTAQSPPVVPPKFDPTKVESIQFQVFTNQSTSTPFSFCVNNLTLLTQ